MTSEQITYLSALLHDNLLVRLYKIGLTEEDADAKTLAVYHREKDLDGKEWKIVLTTDEKNRLHVVFEDVSSRGKWDQSILKVVPLGEEKTETVKSGK